jgi:hypothetical protein
LMSEETRVCPEACFTKGHGEPWCDACRASPEARWAVKMQVILLFTLLAIAVVGAIWSAVTGR